MEPGSPPRPTSECDRGSPAEGFSRRMAPFSGSDQVSAVAELSLFGRKTKLSNTGREGSTSPAVYIEPLQLRASFFFFFLAEHLEELSIESLSASRTREFA